MRLTSAPTRFRSTDRSLLLLALALGGVFPVLILFDGQLYFRVGESAYSVLHSLLEIASILVSFAVFIVNWEASKQNRSSHSLFVATGFLGVAMLDVMHVLSYSTMPAFVSPNDTDKSVYYWIFARGWAAIVLLSAAFVPSSASSRLFSRYLLAAANVLLAFGAFLLVTYHRSFLPSLYVEGEGLTTLKIGMEYLIVGLNGGAAFLYARRSRESDDIALAALALALMVSAYSEVFFTLFRDITDIYNLFGHGYKVFAYYLIFRALLVSSVERPYIQLKKTNLDLGRAVAELHERTRELDALDEVALTLSSSLKPDELLDSAIDKVQAVMQAESGAIFLVDEDSGELRLAEWRGLRARTVAQFQAHPSMLWNIHAARGEPDGNMRAEADGPAPGRIASAGRVDPLRMCVCAPVTTKGHLLGAITMVAKNGRSFADSDVDLLTAVGYQLGLAIENARLYGRTDERLREKLLELGEAERKSRFLAEAAALLASSMDLEKVLGMVARKASEVVGDWCAAYLIDERTSELRLAALYHADPDELDEIRAMLSRKTRGFGEGLIGRVAKTAEPMLLSGEAVQRLWIEMEALAETAEDLAKMRRSLPSSAIIAPMRAGGITVGVLVVTETHSSEPLIEPDLALVTELGDRAGVAIRNSQLLEESQERRRHLEATISQMIDGVVIADAMGEIIVANSAARAMLHGQLADLIGNVGDSLSGSDADVVPSGRGPLIGRALSGTQIFGEEILIAGDAGERVLNASATAVRDDEGEVTGAVVVMRDVTAEREVERMKDEFVATVSHELRTPITAVLGYTDLLLRGMRGPLTPQQKDALASVRSAGHRLLVLIEDLLDISKLEAGKQDLYLESIDVAMAVERALASVALAASSKKVEIVRKIGAGIPHVLADESQVQRILGNLLSNAVKFTAEGGTVTVSAWESYDADPGVRQMVTWLVSDTGVGIPPEKQGRIWEKFQQADSSSSRLFGGTGLGLAIVRALVELHGGRVWVESEGVPGKGSTFGFTLPAAGVELRTTEGIELPEHVES